MMQGFRKRISQAIFKDSAPDLPIGDSAWSEPSAIYTAGNFEKYNPDTLIGRKGYGIYKRMMLDEQVKAVVRFKRDAITSRDYWFELDGELYGLSDEEVKRRIDLMNHIVDKMRGSWQDALNGIMSGMYNGFSMTEKVWCQIEYKGLTFWGLDRLKLRPFDTFTFDVDEYGNVEKVTQKVSSREQAINPDKFIHYVMNPDIDEHYGQSELRECYRAWFSKDVIIKFRNIWLERHAGGMVWAQPNEGTIRPGTPDYVNLQNVLSNIQTKTGIILPKNIDLNTSYPSSNSDFKDAIVDYDMSMARALLVPNLLGVSPQGAHGSLAQSDSQLEAFLWTLEADTVRLEDTLNEQLFRQLGAVNFGDDGWPRIRFKPVSNVKKMEVVNTWKDLVTAGAVQRSDKDEEFLRDLMDFPQTTKSDDGGASTTPPNTALNGAQVTSMVDIVAKVATGEIPKESAKQILVSAYPLSVEEAGNMVDDIEIKEPSNEIPDTNKVGSGNSNSDSSNSDTIDDVDDEDEGKKEGEDDPDEMHKDSTILGKGLISVAAFDKAKQRVDFAVIGRNSEAVTEEYAQESAEVMDVIIADLITQAKTGGDLSEDVSANIAAMKVDGKLKGKLNRVQTSMLREGYALGIKHAETEIDKAKEEPFSRKFDRKRIDMIAEDFFKIRAFKITGNLTDDAVKIIEQEILNGSKYGKSWPEVEKQIYTTFATKGMISMDAAKQALGEALNVNNPDARLRTITRTSTFEAINEARYGYFTDPSLGDFVKAFEYSAILDSRTTSICFTGETPAIPLGRLEHLFRRNYTGDIVTITTASGKKITGTPNHPILTSLGWLPLNEIEPNKHVVYSSAFDVIRVSGDDNVSMPATISELYDSINKPSIGNVQRERSSAEDFHGDGHGGDGEVDILTPNSELRYTVETSLGYFVKNKLFGFIHYALGLFGSRALDDHLIRRLPVAKTPEFDASTIKYVVDGSLANAGGRDYFRWARSIGKHFNYFISIFFRRDVVLSSSLRKHNANALKHTRDGCSGDAVFSAQTSGALPVSVITDNVISKSVELTSCHVYNLQTNLGLYIAGGLVVKNCRHLDEEDRGDHSAEWWEDNKQFLPPNHFSCRSLLIPVTQGDEFVEGGDPTQQPQEGFR